MEFFQKIVAGIILITFPCNFAYAGVTPAEHLSLVDFIKEAKNHPKPKDFLEAVKSKIPKEAYEGMKAHLKDFGQELMPQLRMDGNDTLVLEFKGRMIPMRILSATHQVFLVSNKPVDFSHAMGFDERLAMVKQALPQEGEKHGSWFQFIPEAKAQDSLQRVQGPVISGAGIGVLGAGGATIIAGASTAAILSIMIPGALIVVAGYFLWNAGVCDTIESQYEDCQRDRANTEDRIKKDPNLLRAFSSRRDPACADHGKQTDEDDKIYHNLQSFVHGIGEGSRQLATCREKMGNLRQCTISLSLDAFYGCVTFPKEMGEYLVPWAKEKFEANLPQPLQSTVK